MRRKPQYIRNGVMRLIGTHLPQVVANLGLLLLFGFLVYHVVQHLVCKLGWSQAYVLLLPIGWAIIGMMVAFFVLGIHNTKGWEEQMFIFVIIITEMPLLGYMFGYLSRRLCRIYLIDSGKLKK